MRRLVAVISTIVFLDAMLFGALIPLVPAYVDDFVLSKLQAGLLVGASAPAPWGVASLAASLPAASGRRTPSSAGSSYSRSRRSGLR